MHRQIHLCMLQITDWWLFLSPQEYRELPLPAAWTPAAESEEGSLGEGNRFCAPQSSERPCRTQRTWVLHLYPHHSTPLKNEFEKNLIRLQNLRVELQSYSMSQTIKLIITLKWSLMSVYCFCKLRFYRFVISSLIWCFFEETRISLKEQ